MTTAWTRLILATVMLLGALTGLVDRGTVAYFRSTATDTANVFTAGTVDLANSPASALMTFSDLVPGETVTAPLTVSNSGTLGLRYAVTSSVTSPDTKGLGAQLDLTVKTGVSICTNAGFTATGTIVYGTAQPLGAIGSAINLIGTPGVFPNGGRTLSGAGSETLCFQVSLPASTGAGYQGATTSATFTFLAEQL